MINVFTELELLITYIYIYIYVLETSDSKQWIKIQICIYSSVCNKCCRLAVHYCTVCIRL